MAIVRGIRETADKLGAVGRPWSRARPCKKFRWSAYSGLSVSSSDHLATIPIFLLAGRQCRKCDNAYPCWIKKDRTTVAAKKMPPAIMAIHTSSYAGILNMDGALLHEGEPQARPDTRSGP